MDIAIVGRHTKVSAEFRERIHEKLEKVESLEPKATRIDVHVVHERNPRLTAERERIELTLHSRGPVIRAEAAADDRTVALDQAATKILERLRKRHERRTHRHQGKPSIAEVAAAVPLESATDEQEIVNVEPWEGAPIDATREIPLAGTPIVIRSKTHSGQAMTVSEAIDQMELVGHDFFLFHDSESGLPSAVYRRRGWTYGVIHLEKEAASPAAIDGQELDQKSA